MRPLVPALLMALSLTACTDGAESHRETGATPRSAAMTATPERRAPSPVRESLPCPPGVQRTLVGVRHSIVGHSFGWPKPLTSPPLASRHNKILWELQRPGRAPATADLMITASLNDSETVIHRRVEGHVTPGRTRPSIIDVPQLGCWTFSLTWGAERDMVSIRYRGPG